MKDGWKSVTKAKPCRICKRPTAEHASRWCSYTTDGSVTLCHFVESRTLSPSGGWFHFDDSAPGKRAKHVAESKPQERAINWSTLCDMYRIGLNGHLTEHAAQLGVSTESLEALGAGWDGAALVFGMRDAKWRIVGIRRRLDNPDPECGRQRCVEGSHEGCFGPRIIPAGPLWLPEGPTDTAALKTIGLNAIGRPSCSGGVAVCKAIAAGRDVTIVGDNDKPDKNGRVAGRSGALALGRALIPLCENVRVIFPPDGIKDAREWLSRGLTRKELEP